MTLLIVSYCFENQSRFLSAWPLHKNNKFKHLKLSKACQTTELC